ncbi:MAG TPA: 4-alpha-glucanotransferase [Polyangiaceae bacterium]
MSSPPFRERSSGILLHPTSLAGPFGVGDIGPAAHRFVEFLARSGQAWWQMLPVMPPGGGDSPYDSPSAFAGSPLLVSLELLARDGWLDEADLASPDSLRTAPRALYDAARDFRDRKLRKAFAAFEARASDAERRGLAAFSERENDWLDDHCTFAALSRAHAGAPWTRWPDDLARREAPALERARVAHASEIGYRRFVQFVFASQWAELRARAQALGVRLLGDVPIYVSHDSADVWSQRGVFRLFENGERAALAGVPPDYFSADGQLWGNPVYDWNALRASGYSWWLARLRHTLERFDAARLDHFIGFHRAWEVPAGARSARDGHFVDVPGDDFLRTARDAFGSLPFIAEDLGALTEDVVRLRDRFELPGMRVLEFAFSSSTWREYQPHRYERRTVVSTGTHDNDTVVGWLAAADREPDELRATELRAERARALAYAGSDGREPHWDMLRVALASVANTAIFPIQDLLGLGSHARMNVPGTPAGNWTFRIDESSLTPAVAERLRLLGETYERVPANLAGRG